MIPGQTLANLKWALLIAALVGCYGWGRHDGAALVEAGNLREERLVIQAQDAAARSTAEALAKLEVKHVTIQRAVERETRVEPVYRDCRHRPDGLRAINAALANGAEPAGDGELPADAGDAARPELRGDNG